MTNGVERTIIGLVDASGSGGVGRGSDYAYWFVVHFVAWRYAGAAVQRAQRRCEMPIAYGELHALMGQIGAYQIIEAEIDLDASTSAVTMLRRIRAIGVADPELQQIAAELQQPIELAHPTFGELLYNRRSKAYEGRTMWAGREVDLSLDCADPAQPEAVLVVATTLVADQEGWTRRCEAYAVEQLLHDARDWGENDANLSAEAFLAHLVLEDITVNESGEFSFWYADSDLFGGHVVYVSGDLNNGLTDATIAG